MKKYIITIITIIISTFIFTANAQDKKSEIVDVKLITTKCTITKPIKYLSSIPELDINSKVLKDGVDIVIEWIPFDAGGYCDVYLKIEDEKIPINTWSDDNELVLVRMKLINGHYHYILKNSMFTFFRLLYIDDENPDTDGLGYAFSSELDEND